MLESINKDMSFRKSVYNYGAFIWCSIKTPHFYTDLDLQKTVLNPLANGKIQGLFKAFECFFQVLFKANFIFKDFSRQSCIFKYFSSLCEPCHPNENGQDKHNFWA